MESKNQHKNIKIGIAGVGDSRKNLIEMLTKILKQESKKSNMVKKEQDLFNIESKYEKTFE